MSWLALQTMTQTVAQISVERILNALPEGLLIALFAWALLRVLRRQNSGTRFAVWFIALLAVAALPLLGGLGEAQTPLAPGMSWGHLRPAITIPESWAFYVFLAWALGASAAMARLAAGILHLRRLRQSCTAIAAADLDPAVRKTAEAIVASRPVEKRASLHRSDSITIATSECVRVPAAIGLWKPAIVLPSWALRELPPEDLNVILLHEFAHQRRWDDWTNLIQKIVRALFFFHPAVWWIENRLSVEREMACDDAVLAETASPHGYATCLVALLEKSLAHRLADKHLADKRWSMAQAAVHRAREAALRLARILDTNRPAATRVWKPALGMVGAFSIACLAALPLAPQFVAFDRGIPASNSGHEYSAAGSQPSFRSSVRSSVKPMAVIPAASRTGEPSSVGMAANLMTAKMTTARVVRAHVRANDAAGNLLAPAGVVAARWNALPRERVVEAGANADREIVPQFRTLVFIEATQYVTSDSSGWSVQVWRVTFVTQVRERVAAAPLTSSI